MLVVTGMFAVAAMPTVAGVAGVRILTRLLRVLRVTRLRGRVRRMLSGAVVLVPSVMSVLHHGAPRLSPPKKYHRTATIRITAPATTRISDPSIQAALPSIADGRNRRSRRLFVTTDTLDNDMAALAMIGESSQPVSGYRTPAAMGIPITL
ncbi:hypothetical protein BH23GEM2_BH23GEM2_06230 [soil metagenome]